MNPQLHDFATRYTAAWCSQKPQSVAAFFSPAGSLTINAGSPAVGRAAIAAAAAGFMRAFPDLVVQMETLEIGPPVVYRWLLTGTNTGPGGTGRAVRIGGHEEWVFGPDGLIEKSLGQFDSSAYEKQLNRA
jgi:SnoaL-like polyketide cyclase